MSRSENAHFYDFVCRLETNPSLFLALPGIFEARPLARSSNSREPDIRESRYSSEAQKGLFQVYFVCSCVYPYYPVYNKPHFYA